MNAHELFGAGANKARWGAFGGALLGAAAAWAASKTGEPETGQVMRNFVIPVFKGIGVYGGAVLGYVIQYLIIWGMPENKRMPPVKHPSSASCGRCGRAARCW